MLFQAQTFFRVDTRVDEDGSFAQTRFIVDVDPTPSDTRFEVETISSGPLGLAIPSGNQEAWLGFDHAGVSRRAQELFEFSLSITPDAGPEFTLRTHGFEGDEIGGNETLAWHGRAIDRGAAPPGSDAIDLWFEVIFEPTLTERYQLLTEGRVWRSEEPLIGYEPTTIEGKGYISRFEGVLVRKFSKPAGTALFHGEIIQAHLLAVGIPASRISIPSQLGHSLSALYERACFEGVAEARVIADTAGYILIENGAGVIEARHITPVHLAPVVEIDVSQLETGEITASIGADTEDVPRCWRVDGSRPEIPEQADEFVTVRRMDSETREPFTVPDSFSQNISGDLSLLRAGTTDVRVTAQTWVVETFYRGCLVVRRQETWGQFNPEGWRYRTADPAVSTDGTPFTYARSDLPGVDNGFVFGDGAVKDDSTPMLGWYDFQLVPIAITEDRFIRDSPDTYSGTLVQIVSSVAEWKTLEHAWKAKTGASNTFDEEDVLAGIRFFAGGRPVTGLGSAVGEAGGFARELWFAGPAGPTVSLGNHAEMGPTTVGSAAFTYGQAVFGDILTISKWAAQTNTTITAISIDLGDGRPYGFETRRSMPQEGYTIGEDGDQFQYRNGDTRGTINEAGALILTVNETYTPDGDSTHSRGTTETDGKDRFVKSTTEGGQSSYLPQTDVCNDETQALASTVAVAGKYCINSAQGDFVDRVQKDNIAFGVETDAAAAELAKVRLRERSALSFQFSFPMTPVFSPKIPIKLTALHKGIDPDTQFPGEPNGWVEDVRHAAKGRSKVVVVSGRIRVF